jgi:hypothetical protein
MSKTKQSKTRAQQVIEAMKHCTSTDETRRHICNANVIVESDSLVTLQATDGHMLLQIHDVSWQELCFYFRKERGFELPVEPKSGRIFTNDNTRKKSGQLWFVSELHSDKFPSDTYRVRPKGKNPDNERPKFAFNILKKVEKIYKSLGMLDIGFVPDNWDDANAGEKLVDGGFLVVMGYRS